MGEGALMNWKQQPKPKLKPRRRRATKIVRIAVVNRADIHIRVERP